MFVDQVEIVVRGGRGGDGCVSFLREKYVPKGGPDGGDGGNGGSVVLLAKEGVDSLAAFAMKKLWVGKRGISGQGYQRHGANAEDTILFVPPGTMVYDAEAGFLMKDLAHPGDTAHVARGGAGGKGNMRFRTSQNRAPRQATPGEEGEARTIRLELKVIADVGLVGKPNAGKSTLLSRLSRARPKIADYPFTTKYPNLGRVSVGLDYSFVIADIPGLIEGAHKGAGLGHEFLRHIERAGILVHLVEPLPMDGTSPVENYLSIRHELEQYDAVLAKRPEILVVTKGELPDAEDVRRELVERTGAEPLVISAVTGLNLNILVQRIVETLRFEREGERD
ncbi:MAG: GTPase ObgE [Planctomycetia bacterium]|nr:GTPase ObgE [Planctomycetia bacterium]